jgi:hypothetical protein
MTFFNSLSARTRVIDVEELIMRHFLATATAQERTEAALASKVLLDTIRRVGRSPLYSLIVDPSCQNRKSLTLRAFRFPSRFALFAFPHASLLFFQILRVCGLASPFVAYTIPSP